jgi:ABC-type multidrug transport system ATPase subunit
VSDFLVLDGFSPAPQGPTLTMTLRSGQSLCLMGPAGGGKTRFIRSALGAERPSQGRTQTPARVMPAGSSTWPRRATPIAIARKAAHSRKTDLVAEALMLCGLWDRREDPVEALSGSQRAACEVLSCIAAEPCLMSIDGQLDRLDPWTLRSALHGLHKRMTHGSALLVATNRPDLASHFDHLVVLAQSQVRFVGTVEELMREHSAAEIVVETKNQPGVRALVDSFEVSIRETADGLVIRTAEAQEIAARLLTEGYGDVRMVVVREPSVQDVLNEVVK